MALRPSRSIFS
nr:TPA_asm: m44.6 sORF 4 [Murid betaherpesvirus 1]DBA07775.1 TPA_asm: m44.6 sORF 4 [Murid betaherpesvirus 1]